MTSLMDSRFDFEFTKDVQLVDGSELPPVAGHVAVEYRNTMIVWGGYYCDTDSQFFRPSEYIYIYPYDLAGKLGVWIKYKVSEGDCPLQATASCGLIYGDNFYIFGGNVTRSEQGIRIGSATNELYKLSLITGRWELHKNEGNHTPTPRDKVCGFVTKEGLFYFGGYGPSLRYVTGDRRFLGQGCDFFEDDDQGNYSWNNQLLCYDWEKWNLIKQSGMIPSHRAAAAAVYVKDDQCTYLFGGRHAQVRLNDLYRLDLRTFMWTMIEFEEVTKPIGRSWASLTYNPEGQYLLLYGGLSADSAPLSDKLKLEIKENTVDCKPMTTNTKKTPIKRLWHSTVFVKNAFISYGGMKEVPNSPIPCTSDMDIMEISPTSLTHMSLTRLTHKMHKENAGFPYECEKGMLMKNEDF
ncbi:hypothetical protein FO519_008863 [Halicephalobus sp. NKZ332]|nr:hypothetical protein FO519_008863 [Halicephalobus sp. NKZ332]